MDVLNKRGEEMTIKEEIQIEEYKRTFAEAYKQGFIDAMSVCKTEPTTEDCSTVPTCSKMEQVDKDINVLERLMDGVKADGIKRTD